MKVLELIVENLQTCELGASLQMPSSYRFSLRRFAASLVVSQGGHYLRKSVPSLP